MQIYALKTEWTCPFLVQGGGGGGAFACSKNGKREGKNFDSTLCLLFNPVLLSLSLPDLPPPGIS